MNEETSGALAATKTLTPESFSRPLKVCAAVLFVAAFFSSFTVSDYYIFNRFDEFSDIFVISQWVKKAGYILIAMAVFFRSRSCADAAKYMLPVFVLISLFTYGQFFDVTMVTEEASSAQIIYAQINEFMPKWANMTLFFLEAALELAICVMLFIRDGFAIELKSLIFMPLSFVAATPLNIFENFYDKAAIAEGSFLNFTNYSLWHILYILSIAALCIGLYYYLRKKSPEAKWNCLCALSITMLLQYSSRYSMLMGDGYNTYNSILAAVPLFVCNIGTYLTAFGIFTRNRPLMSLSFFVFGAGAITVFGYLGRPEITNYGIFCSYTSCYLMTTHGLLFACCITPSAVGLYKYRHRDAILGVVFVFLLVVVATVVSGLITSASMGFSYDGYCLSEEELIVPNYAYTQVNPLPIESPFDATITIWRYEFNVFYLCMLFLAYVAIFYVFNLLYFIFLRIRRAVIKKKPDDADSQI